MNHVRNILQKSAALLLLLSAFALTAAPAIAASSLSVTVTPPLIQLTIGPGETWRSSLKIVNTNGEDVTYYTQLMDMQASDESGHSSFTPIVRIASTTDEGSTLAQWIEVPSDPIVVKAGSSGELPFTVKIPQDASPGGHYAAILVGTQPGSITGSGIKVSSYVSSLIFVKIKGDVIESGRVREFSTDKDLYQSPHADFLLRFENTGNTHLRPAGTIEIYNMWGKERGKLDIAQDSTFGNVLPHSVRRFNFSWDGEESVFDIGRYSAVVTLAYGDGGKQNATAVTYFWVVPVVPVAVTLGSIVVFFMLVTWLIRRYIRRALALSMSNGLALSLAHGVALERQPQGAQVPDVSPAPRPTSTVQALIEPIKEGVIDLRAMAQAPTRIDVNIPAAASAPRRITISQLLRKYRLFLLFVFVVFAGAIGAWLYFRSTLQPQRSFQITDVKIDVEDAQPQ